MQLAAPVTHLWQPHEGFRLARLRNRAIAAANGEYVMIVDGDMVLHRHFVADHLAAARHGSFIQGVRLLTRAPTAERMLREGSLDLHFFASGIRRRRHMVRNLLLSRMLFWKHTGQSAIRGCNQAYWKSDLLRVNGFNEAFVGWGREDNEIAARLYNVGVLRRNLKFQALAIHLHHPPRHPLLCHILGSHPQIDGYCETHIKYRTRLDLLRLRSRVVRLTGEPLRGHYVLDKILHNYPMADGILRSRNTLAVMLLRRPVPTVRSIINMGLYYGDIPWHRDLDLVSSYYEERLGMLVRLAERLRGRAVFMEAEALLSRTAEALHRIAGLLELSEPLRADYRCFAHTGERSPPELGASGLGNSLSS